MTGKLLVFGANGQVGQALGACRWPLNIQPRLLSRTDCDITDQQQVAKVFARHHPVAVINAAAYTAVDRAETEPDVARLANAVAPEWIAQACATAEVPIVHLSTDYVFDGQKAGAYNEDDPVAPISVYGQTKEAGERAVRAAHEQHVIVRTQWVYSATGNNFCKTMLRLGKERDRLGIVADQHGAPTFAEDIATALRDIVAQLVISESGGPYGTWHFANAGETTWYGFAREIFDHVKRRTGQTVPSLDPLTTDQYPTPARRPKNSVFDCSRIQRDFGVAPRRWEDALADCLDVLLADVGTA